MYNQNTGHPEIVEPVNGFTQFTDLGVVFGAQWQYEGSGDYLRNGQAGFLMFNRDTGDTELVERLSGTTQLTDLHTVLGTQWLFKGTGNYLEVGWTSSKNS